MAQRANVESARVAALINKFNQHKSELEYKHKSLLAYFKGIQNYWNDHHYQSTAQYFEEYDKAIRQAIKMADEIMLPHLKNVKKFAEDYEKMGGK